MFDSQLGGLPKRIEEKISALAGEEDQYAADELVELAEEVLHQIAAVGVRYYLNSGHQKEVYNDFLLELFNSSGHDYNAGPIFRWVANMIKDLDDEMPSEYYSFFWKDGELNKKVHHLAVLRNEVMHGFFVLPPERNVKETEGLVELLQQLTECEIFKGRAVYHFLDSNGFTGNWNITDESQWQALMGPHPFGQLCRRIIFERGDEFWQSENELFHSVNFEVPEAVQKFILNNKKGAFAVWVHPRDKTSIDLYSSIGAWLKQQDVTFVGYQLSDQGLSYTGGFLLNRLMHALKPGDNAVIRNKKSEEVVKKLRAEAGDRKVVVLIHQIHLALFSPQHVSKLSNFLYENDILLIAVGHHYEHFNGLFNSSITMDYAKETPSNEEALIALHNYLRFKGPSKDRSDEMADVKLLEEILEKVLSDLGLGHSIYARRFADDYGCDIEYVHEIFALLHPWVNTSRESFEPDTVDELYGFPSTMTEVTPIYLALGRRDLKLEYQHKVISL